MGLFDRFRRKAKDADEAPADAVDAGEDDLDLDAEGEEAEDALDDAGDADVDDTDEDADDDEVYAKSAPLDRAEKGPWDAGEDFDEQNRIDLGALQIPVRDGMQVRLDAEDKTGRILAVTLVHQGGALQLQAFAAPTTEGLWNTVRAQIADNVAKKNGVTDELYTALGKELQTKIPARTKEGKAVARVVRFAGVDGPRWFVRGMFSGKAITDDDVRADLVSIFRGTIVDRGTEAMPPRELLVLSEPKARADAAADDGSDSAGAASPRSTDDLNPFERGPEITEIR